VYTKQDHEKERGIQLPVSHKLRDAMVSGLFGAMSRTFFFIKPGPD